MVKHCKGKVKLWQNDCEPTNPVFWNGTETEFVEQLKVFHKAVKDADPQAQVILGGFDGLFNPPGMHEFPNQQQNVAFFERTIAHASSYFDVFDIRLYADPYTIPYRVNYFSEKLKLLETPKPMVCTEYNGPGFFEFSPNRRFFSLMGRWNQAIATLDTASYFQIQDEIRSIYHNAHAQPPETQLFLAANGTDMAAKYSRLQARDVVVRNVLALSVGIRRTLFWDLWHNTDNPYDVMTVIYGKNKLMEFKDGKFVSRYPLSGPFRRMVEKLGNVESVTNLAVPGQQNLYLFEVVRADKSKMYVCWEKRDTFSGEDQPATAYMLPWKSKKAIASDIFGESVRCEVRERSIHINLSGTPVFIAP